MLSGTASISETYFLQLIDTGGIAMLSFTSNDFKGSLVDAFVYSPSALSCRGHFTSMLHTSEKRAFSGFSTRVCKLELHGVG